MDLWMNGGKDRQIDEVISLLGIFFKASIFGDILLNVSRQIRLSYNKRSLAHMSKKKATFIYQFLVNDLTVEYN